MRANRTKQLLREGKIALGMSQSQLRTPELAKMAAAVGLDWLFIDTEHSPFTSETVHELIGACRQTPVTPVVRVADFQYDLVARTLDSGAEGIMFPRSEHPEMLERAVSWAKFPPKGVRGFGLAAPQMGYQDAPFDEVTAHANREILVIAQIETMPGLERVEELAAVDGLDCLLVGPADMTVALGVGGQWEHPKLMDALERVSRACHDVGKWPAIHVRNVALAKAAAERGMRLISCGNDLAVLWNIVKKLGADLGALRELA